MFSVTYHHVFGSCGENLRTLRKAPWTHVKLNTDGNLSLGLNQEPWSAEAATLHI